MKKKIEIEFTEKELDNVASENLEAILYKTIIDIKDYADVKKVSIDGNVFWLKEKEGN
jgi:hypothetical protein